MESSDQSPTAGTSARLEGGSMEENRKRLARMILQIEANLVEDCRVRVQSPSYGKTKAEIRCRLAHLQGMAMSYAVMLGARQHSTPAFLALAGYRALDIDWERDARVIDEALAVRK